MCWSFRADFVQQRRLSTCEPPDRWHALDSSSRSLTLRGANSRGVGAGRGEMAGLGRPQKARGGSRRLSHFNRLFDPEPASVSAGNPDFAGAIAELTGDLCFQSCGLAPNSRRFVGGFSAGSKGAHSPFIFTSQYIRCGKLPGCCQRRRAGACRVGGAGWQRED
jgi:hypothetical protein